MFNLEKKLRYLFINEERTRIIRTHSWSVRKALYNLQYGLSGDEHTFCLKCNVEFEKVVYRQQDSSGVKWAELSCNEILIKNLLE